MAASIDVSVIVCTYNRADSLKLTLDSFCELHVNEQLTWELIIVINNSTDHTESVVNSYESLLPIKVFFEKQQGLSHSRNRGIAESQGDLLVFTDDDVNVSLDWLSEYYKKFRQSSNIDYFGGPIHPVWPESGKERRPAWLKRPDMPLLAGLLGLYDLNSADRYYQTNDMHPYGANFAISREAAMEIGMFNSDLGMKGNIPGRGEEAEYFTRMHQLEKVGFYINAVKVEHRFENHRLKMGYLYRYGKQKGIAEKQIRLVDGSLTAESEQKKDTGTFFAQQFLLFLKAIVKKFTGEEERYIQSIILLGIRAGQRLN